MNKIVRTIVLGVFLVLFAALSFAQDMRVTEKVLPNGLKVLLKEEHKAPVVTFQVWYKVGSRNEKLGTTGMSHLLEHMMFKGTKKHGPKTFSQTVQRNGGNDNAFTAKDYTAYFETFAADRIAQRIFEFRPVEGAFARIDCGLDAVAATRFDLLEHVHHDALGVIPRRVRADALFRPRRQLHGKVAGEAEVVVGRQDQIVDLQTLLAHLLFGAEDMGVVLGKRAHAQQPGGRLLGAADDDSAAATARRDAVSVRVDEFNAVIARVCAATDGCIDDAGALHAYPFTTDQLSSIDFFHPSMAGQRAIAEIAWDALERGAG